MKQYLMIAAAAAVAACGAPKQPDYWTATRAGYGVDTGVQTAAGGQAGGNYRAGAEAALDGHAAMRAGVHKTRTGAPWLVAHSEGFQARGERLDHAAAAQAALVYQESERNSPYAAKTHLGASKTRFRIVTVDGSSFAVLFALDMPKSELRTPDSAALTALSSHVAQISGCTVTGAALAQRERNEVRRLATPVHCA
jgi:hypothetical protein